MFLTEKLIVLSDRIVSGKVTLIDRRHAFDLLLYVNCVSLNIKHNSKDS